MEKEEYYAGSLYVVRPSRIVDITGNVTKNKKNNTNYVKQTAIFERQLRPIIACKTLAYGFYDLFNHDKDNNKIRTYYYDALQLNQYGITVDDKKRYFYNVFDGDKILLSDYLFSYKFKNSMVNKIKFFKYPFSMYDMQLKPSKSKELLADKKFYTKEELQNIFDEIQTHIIEPMESIKSYKVVKQPQNRVFKGGVMINKGPLYAGTEDDIDIRRQKSLKLF